MTISQIHTGGEGERLPPRIPERVFGVIERIALQAGCSAADILGRHRAFHIARVTAWIAIRALRRPDGLRFSYPQIGRWFDRHHTTVLQGIDRHV